MSGTQYAPNPSRRSQVLRNATVGLVVGLVVGALGELATFIVSRLFPTDVQIVGFALIWAAPAGIAVGAITGWFNWLREPGRLVAVCAALGLLAGIASALIQWSAV